MTAASMTSRLRSRASAAKAAVLRRFFKTGPGEYGAGDVFLGVVMPDIRRTALECYDAPIPEIMKLLRSRIHEARMLALLLLIGRYETGEEALKKNIYRLYLRNTAHINNWDLVDLSAPNILGAHLLTRSRKPLYALARSRDLWKRRMAILATFTFIRQYDFADALAIAELLLRDEHDLIHKAVGWMLREVGKRSLKTEEAFLRRYCTAMPRTMLRYAVERFPETKRRKYMKPAASR